MAVAIHAANLRVTHRLKPRDAPIAGTAMAIDADAIVTNDAGWPSAPEARASAKRIRLRRPDSRKAPHVWRTVAR